MSDAEIPHADVAPFPCHIFRGRQEYESLIDEIKAARANRWLYEQSLASLEDHVIISGTCGICLCEARFISPTRGGEITAAGRVPNWREAMVCDCEQLLTNRERSLLHYLLATGSLQPWMRVLALGETSGLKVPLSRLSTHLMSQPTLEVPTFARPFHLVISQEQLGVAHARPDVLAGIANLLVRGGRFIFTAPFDVTTPVPDSPRISWPIFDALKSVGFEDASACTFWSEEFGYLGMFNLIFCAYK